MGIEDQRTQDANWSGCPQCDSRELLEISQETACRNYWYSDNSFPEAGAIRTRAKKLELRKFLDKNVAAIAFACPCKPGEPVDITRGGTIETVGFAYYKNWVALDPCETEEEIPCDQDCDPYSQIPYEEKYRRHIADKTAALTEAVRTRYELIATFLKLWGSYMVFGPKMDSYMIDFERNNCLHLVLRNNYCDINTFPVQDMQMFDNLFKRNSRQANGRSGQTAARYTFGVDAWTDFSMHYQVQRHGFVKACDCTEPGNDLGIQSDDCGIEFAGTFNNKPVYIDGRTYIDADGVEKFYMPQDALLIESNEMNGARAHSTVYSPSANFQPGDFHFRQWWCDPDEAWTLEVQGSILMFPRNVNTAMLVRNVGRARTQPGDGSVDEIMNAEGEVYSPPKAEKGQTDEQWEQAMKDATDSEYFALCCALVGRAPPQVPCNNGMKAECVPGKWLTITPAKDPCPTAPKKCISKEILLNNGYTDKTIAEAIFYGGLEPSTLAECLAIPQPLLPPPPASEEVQEAVGVEPDPA